MYHRYDYCHHVFCALAVGTLAGFALTPIIVFIYCWMDNWINGVPAMTFWGAFHTTL